MAWVAEAQAEVTVTGTPPRPNRLARSAETLQVLYRVVDAILSLSSSSANPARSHSPARLSRRWTSSSLMLPSPAAAMTPPRFRAAVRLFQAGIRQGRLRCPKGRKERFAAFTPGIIFELFLNSLPVGFAKLGNGPNGRCLGVRENQFANARDPGQEFPPIFVDLEAKRGGQPKACYDDSPAGPHSAR